MASIPSTSGIYKITCTITGKFYIGSAMYLDKRRNQHFSDFHNGTHRNSKLQRAFNKYGEASFIFEVIEFVLSPFLLMREQHWLDKLQPFGERGFNIDRIAGSRIGHKPSLSTREKLSVANLGRKDSEETIRKRADVIKGRSQSAKTIESRRLGKGYIPIEVIHARLSTVHIEMRQDTELRVKPVKSLIVIDPEGIGYHVYGIRQFCREHNLDRSTLMRVARGKQLHHKGWIARYPDAG